jgi:hypothetical protein
VAGYLIHCSTVTLAQVMCVTISRECFVVLFAIRKSKYAELNRSLQKFCIGFYCNNKIQDENTTDIPECLHICPPLSIVTISVHTLFSSVW